VSRWSNLVRDFPNVDTARTTYALDQYGDDGWELVAVVPIQKTPAIGISPAEIVFRVFFKREVTE